MGATAEDVAAVQDAEESVVEETGDTVDEKTTAQVMFVVPIELKKLIDAKADEAGRSTSGWLRGLVAEELDYELPVSVITRKKKYATDDERKAAQAASAKTRNELIKRLLAEYRAGNIDIDEDDLAEVNA